MSAPVVLVMAKAPRPGYAKTRLEPLLGPLGAARLQATLITRTLAWARAVAPGAVFLAYTPAGARRELARLAAGRARLFPQVDGDLGTRLRGAVAHAYRIREGPLLVVGTDTPALGAAHAEAGLAALARGADVCFGPALDGGYYLAALGRERPEVFDLPRDAWGGPDVLALSCAAARRAGLRTETLWPERDLDTPADALADPRAGALVAEALGGLAA